MTKHAFVSIYENLITQEKCFITKNPSTLKIIQIYHLHETDLIEYNQTLTSHVVVILPVFFTCLHQNKRYVVVESPCAHIKLYGCLMVHERCF